MADLEKDVLFPEGLAPPLRMLLVDAQTSGGILMAVDPETVQTLLSRLREKIPEAAIIGELTEGPPGRIQVS